MVMKVLGVQYSLCDVKVLGIVGQMYGVILLDKLLQVLCLVILWNDGCCVEECQLLEDKVSVFWQIIGNLMMLGFMVLKFLWVQCYEVVVFSQVDKVLLFKDYLCLCMIGEFVSDMFDVVGMMWLDVVWCDWSDEMFVVCDFSWDVMLVLFEGSDVIG